MPQRPELELPLYTQTQVLVPGAQIVLHARQLSHRGLLADVVAADGRLAVLWLRGAGEIMTDRDFAGIGTIAEVLDVGPDTDGGTRAVVLGRERFRLLGGGSNGSDLYRRMRVEILPERLGRPSAALCDAALQAAGQHAELLSRVTGLAVEVPAPDGATALSYALTAAFPLAQPDRQSLLESASTEQRLRQLVVLLRRENALLRSTGSVPVPLELFGLAQPG